MSDQNARRVPDLGFFAGTGETSQLSGGHFGGSPGGVPFGTPAAFGSPAPPPAPPSSRHRQSGTPALVVAGIVGVALLVALVLGGRFVWSHFLADPVVPPTLQGLPQATDAASTAQLQVARQQVMGLLSDGSEAEVALYTDGQSAAYVLMSVRGAVEDFSPGDDVPAPFTGSEHGSVTCGSVSVAQVAGSPGITICVRGFYRRAVVVYAVAMTSVPDPVTVARATEEAWDAQ